MTTVYLHCDDVRDTLALPGALLADRNKLPDFYILSTTGADVDWDPLEPCGMRVAVPHVDSRSSYAANRGRGMAGCDRRGNWPVESGSASLSSCSNSCSGIGRPKK
jgi:hypothetical protein